MITLFTGHKCVHHSEGTLSEYWHEWLHLKWCLVCDKFVIRRRNSDRYEVIE